MPEHAFHTPVLGTRRGAVLLALSLMLLMVAAGMCFSLMPIVTAEMQDRFGFSASQIGLLTSVFMLAFGLGAIPLGLAGARWGGRVLLAGTGLLALGTLLFAFTASYSWFLVGRLLQGVGAGGHVPVANALLAHAVGRRYQGWALGVFGCGHGVGVVAGLLILPSAQAAGGYRAAFLVTAGIATVFLMISSAHKVVRGLPPRMAADLSFTGLMRAVGTVALNWRLLLLIAMNLGVGAVFVGLITWTPSFLHDQRGASLAVAAYLSAGIGAAQILGNIFGAAAMSRWGKTLVLVVGMAVMLIATVLVPFAPGTAAVFVCVTVAGFLTMAMFPPLMGSIPEVVPRLEQVGPASGYLSTVNLLATLLTPWLFGVLLDSYGTAEGDRGYLFGYQFVALFALVGTLAAVGYAINRRRAGRQRAQQPTQQPTQH